MHKKFSGNGLGRSSRARNLSGSCAPGRKAWPAAVEFCEPRILFSSATLTLGDPIVVARATVTGTVYNDSNGNGRHDAGETGAAGITVYDDVNNNRVLDAGEVSAVTDSAGAYTLSDVPAGPAIIRESIAAGAAQTAPINQWGIHLTILANQIVNAVNFEQKIGQGTISGNVYDDANRNGKRDAGEAGLANWAVYIDLHNDGHYVAGDPLPLTDAAGNFSFAVSAPAGYIVRVFAPAGNVQTAPGSNLGQHVSVNAGQSVVNVNFGFFPLATGTASLSGTVRLSDGSAAPAGWTVYLDNNNNGRFDNGEITTATAANGTFSFTGLAGGTYIARVVTPVGYEQFSPANNFGAHVTLASGQAVTGEDFTYRPISTASISGTVFNDANGNGIRDSGEMGLAGWTVYLDLDDSGAYAPGDPIPTTDSSGAYQFTGLPAGTYIVRVQTPANYLQIAPAHDFGRHVTLGDAQQVGGVNFGEQLTTVATL